MKRFFSMFFIFMCLMCCGLFYGCGDKYANLSFSIEVSYDGASSVEDLSNGDKRVLLKNGGAFDDHLDGSYTFYIISDTNTKTTATIQANINGAPDNFNYEVVHSLSTEILTISNTSNSVKKQITANSKGRTELTLVNVESGKKDRVIIDVVEVASSMHFINENLAIVGTEGSTLTLDNNIVKLYPQTSSLTNVVYELGEVDGNNEFNAWNSNQLVTYGIMFNRDTSVIRVINDNLRIDKFSIKATYDNPVGEDIVAVTDVKVVNALTDFSIYKGTTPKDAKNSDNLINATDINDLIVNIIGLNNKNIILKVKSNGEKVDFSYLLESSFPVYFPNSTFSTLYFRQDCETSTMGNYEDATYCLCFINICANTKTTLNDRYPNGTYTVKFICDYANYKVDNYPITTNFVVKNDNLITSFSVNGDVLENYSIVNNETGRPYEAEVYINSSSNVNGTPLNIDVGNTDTILASNKKFKLNLYKYNSESGEFEDLLKTYSLTEFFNVRVGMGSNSSYLEPIDNFSNFYDCNSTFYFLPNVISNKVNLGDEFYLVVTAQKPFENEDKQAKATIKLNMVYGVDSFDGFNYSYSQYKVDPETGEYILIADEPVYEIDPDTGKFVIDPITGDKVLAKPITYKKVKETYTGTMNFENFMSKDSLNLDLSSGFDATISLICNPSEANLNNINIVSSNEKVFEIVRDEQEKNTFKIKVRGVGKEKVIISLSHLDVEYSISINVYNPISKFNVNLANTSITYGIGDFEVNDNNDLVSAVVEIEKSIVLNLTTTPSTSNQYSIEFSAYSGKYLTYKDIIENGVFLNKYSIDYNGVKSSEVNIIGDVNFMFTCAVGDNKGRCTFVFPFTANDAIGKEYTILIRLTNIDGSVINKFFVLQSFVPIDTIKTDITSEILYNPNTLSYVSKTQDLNDPSVFGLKIEALSNKKGVDVTYNFDNYGRISIVVNNIEETVFTCSNGRLTVTNSNKEHLLFLIDEYTRDGYYWFKLNENYNFSNVVGTVSISIQINQLDYWVTLLSSFRTKDAEGISSLVTYTDEQLYYKQGYSEDKLVDIQILEDTSFNKNLHIKVYDIVTINGKNFYYDLVNSDAQNLSCVGSTELLDGRTSSQFNLKITPSIAGQSVIIVMPEDKIITSLDYQKFTQKIYTQVIISEEEFIEGLFYVRNGANYTLANIFNASETYYTYSTNIDSVISLWEDCLVFYMTVADGVKVPYHLASYKDIKEISLNSDSVTKRYVFTKDIPVVSKENWQSIGNYYLVGKISQEDFNNSVYYINDGENFIEANAYSSMENYYAFGFNGEISGKFTYYNVKTKQEVDNYYKISGISFEGEEDDIYSGFVYSLGKDGILIDLNVSYSVFRPTLNNKYIFGGISAVNLGLIENSITSFDNFSLSTNYKTIIGGIVGENKGIIKNNKLTNLGVRGRVRVVAKSSDANIIVGGITGENKGYIYGSVVTGKPAEYTFNDTGFNSTLNVIAELDVNAQGTLSNSSIGGAVGVNYGLLKNVSIKGSVNAVKYNNVGGLVGTAEYNEDFNADGQISIDSSYSIANVTGNNNVGGAIGSINGSDTNRINLSYVSAENYATASNSARIFVQGKNNVGGLIGIANGTNIEYCYVVSYFDCMPVDKTGEEEITYDILGTNAGGFIGNANNVSISNSSSFVNVRAEQTADLFIQTISSSSVDVAESFVIGYTFGGNGTPNNFTSVGVEGFFYYIACNKSGDNTNDVIIRDSISPNNNIQAKDIITHFLSLPNTTGWERNVNANSGLPYLTITFETGLIEPLFATSPINVSAIVKSDENQFVSYIRNNDDSLIIFLNKDDLTKYRADDINKLNLVSFLQFIDLNVYPLTSKSARLDISTSNSKVISIDASGILRIVDEGMVTITISSKLNGNENAKIYIVVKYGISDVKVNKDISSDVELNKSDIEILKSNTQELFVDVSYIRNLEHTNNAKLKASKDVGVRFRVREDLTEEEKKQNELLPENKRITSLKDILASFRNEEISNVTNINDIFKFNGDPWLYDGEFWYIDISSNRNPAIIPIVAMLANQKLKIEYVPFIKTTFNNGEATILLDEFAGDFTLSIIKGATDIIIENNIDTSLSVEISQLETHTFTVTIFTDYELEKIIDDTTEQNVGDLLSIVKSNFVINKDETGKFVKSISTTYTINYKDKINAVENDITYIFTFRASSNPGVKKQLKFTIVGQDKINQVYGTIYSKVDDFPQQPNNNSVIYNGQVGVLSIEVYPYFSNYNKMRVYYRSPSLYPLLITQLSYDIKGSTGRFLSNYPESGAITDMSGVMQVEKSSGQDTYLLNTGGIYSYSKIYFFSLLVGSKIPDNTSFTFFVEFLNRQGTIIETYSYTFTTREQPSVEFEFDSSLKGSDDYYYMPINTTQNLDVTVVNYQGEIEWSVSCLEEPLNQNEIDILTPYLNKQNKYEIRIFNYINSLSADNVFSTDYIGKHITVTATIRDKEGGGDKDNSYHFSQTFVVTLFTVTGVSVQNVSRGYMTIPMSTTTPLLVNIDKVYDETLITNEDNWYSNWYKLHGENKDVNDKLYSYLRACGYEIEEHFSRYFNQLSNAIARANYNYKDSGASTKISGVWFYDSNDENSGYLQVGKDYNNSTFGVEQYNEYIAVYGYQIDRNSKMILRTNISYTNNEDNKTTADKTNGIPNVYNYSISIADSTFDSKFTFQDEFILNFVYKSDLINAIPVSTAEEFINMQEGFDYRLVNDIELNNYTPISTPIATLDGNNFNIYITGFSYSDDYSEDCVLGLFENVSKNTILYNVTVHYTNRIINYDDVRLTPSPASLTVTQLYVKKLNFGGIAVNNEGVLTNCKVTGKFNLILNNNVNVGIIPETLNGGLVANNKSTGFITNSSVYNFDLYCYGTTGGFVGKNNGKIVSSFFNESSIDNQSSSEVAGFVYDNTANIYECYTQGYRAINDNDIRNTGAGITAKGAIGGFAYNNSGNISDCYSNIFLQSSSMLAGFVLSETTTSIISRCYSISYGSMDSTCRVASPFAGASLTDFSIPINGQLNNCYYLSVRGSAWSDVHWADNTGNESKRAKDLTLDEFSTHTNFASFDLSLVYNDKLTYADSEETYSYVDGYTWVIIKGKPVIVSTLIRTISQRNYIGKTKNYSEILTYFQASDFPNLKSISSNIRDKVRTNYYDESKVFEPSNLKPEDILFYTIKEITDAKNDKGYTIQKISYYFNKNLNNTSYNDAISIVLEQTLDGDKVISQKIISAQYGTEKIVVLDARIQDNDGFIEDSNFRANDTIEIEFNENNVINKIEYKVIENASYYYGSNAQGADVIGTRTNPQIIYDYESFVYYLNSDTAGRFYRIIKDIDFIGNQGYYLPDTVYSNFQGVLQGNYMTLNQISFSYVNNLTGSEVLDDQEAFGLFGTISTVPGLDNFNTVISNLTLNVVEVLSNTHERVGALAGLIHTDRTTGTGTRLILNNISVGGVGSRSAYVQGKNVAGGLAGIILGDVIIKDITVSANVNATKDVSSGNVGEILYIDRTDISKISYSGGVAGILDCNGIIDASTLRNYNASNIHTFGNIHISGGVVGMAFGLVGRNSVVNYVNVDIENTNKNYIESSVYAGGIVGENRGTIISSSISYREKENYRAVSIGESSLIENLLFRSSAGSDSAIASGGLIGLNNGGIITNSISTIDVRDDNTKIAGGAVGRLITGRLENILAYGSVMSKGIIGGLVGTVNDSEIVLDAGYNASAIATTSVDNSNKTIIKNCVAANNWQIQDYYQYEYLQVNTNPVAGFIGLISNVASNNNFIKFEGHSFFTNTLYATANINVPDRYLKVAYFSNTIDLIANLNASVKNVLVGSDNNQAVFPCSIREAYYEDTNTKISYTITESRNPNYKVGNKDPYVYTIYELNRNYTIENPDEFYVEIDFNDSYWEDNNLEWGETTRPSTYKEYKEHFGIIYYKDENDGSFKKLIKNTESERDENEFQQFLADGGKLYYVRSAILPRYVKTTKYLTNGHNDIVVDVTGSGAMGGNKYNDYTFTSYGDLEKINSIYINGMLINEIGERKSYTGDGLSSTSYSAVYEDVNFTLPNNTKVIKISINANLKTFELDGIEGGQRCWEISSIDLTYEYEISKKYVSIKAEENTGLGNNWNYAVHLSSKEVIYNSFINNGYWKTTNKFLEDTNGDYDEAEKYPVNLEYAEVYLWSNFASKDEWTPEQIANGNLRISTPEELAMFANLVNAGQTFEGKTINLIADVDLSGKFWVPIGSKDNVFKGVFNGNGHTISYTTVNETSNKSVNSVGGLFGYVQNATIQNFSTIGGDIYGSIAGGVVAVSNGKTIIDNVLNRNNVTGEIAVGGIIGKIITTDSSHSITITNSINYGDIENQNSIADSDNLINIGGIVGYIDSNATAENFENLTNYGSINVSNNRTTYTGTAVKIELNVGGVIGAINVAGNNFISLKNYGDITVTSNSHLLNVGGIVGLTKKQAIITLSKNYAYLDVTYNNIYNVGKDAPNISSAMVGGIIGYSIADVTTSGNEGGINFSLSTTSRSFISIGGVAGSTISNIEKCYNSNNIEIYTITRRADVTVGGILGSSSIKGGDRVISDCYNSGDIQVTSSSKSLYAGGIVGASYVEDSTNVSRDVKFTGDRLTKNKLAVNTCLNVGYVNIIAIAKLVNGLGAIAGYGNFGMQFKSNYYLRDSAFSGNYIYKAYCLFDNDEEDDEERGYYSVDGENNFPKLKSSLKERSTYNSDWIFFDEKTNTGIWQQFYDTWYPSLRDNNASSMWSDKTEEITQSQGSFIIKSAEELSYFAELVNSGAIDTTNITVRLTNFIDLSNRYWTPIGTINNPFKGKFDGNGYVIRNLTIDGTFVEDKAYGALFGYCEEAVITNIGLEYVIIKNVNFGASVIYNAYKSEVSRVYSDGAEDSNDAIISSLQGAGGLIYNAQDCSPLFTTKYNGGLYYSYNNLPVETIGVKNVIATGGLVGNLENSIISNSYNNVNGNVKTTALFDGLSAENNGCLIAGIGKGSCAFINVFSLASTFQDGASSSPISCEPRLFSIKKVNEYLCSIEATADAPLYENFFGNKETENNGSISGEDIEDINSSDIDLSSIWTQENEYTLNKPVEGVYYPSIRGLGGNWKNTESEALIAIDSERIYDDLPIYLEQLVKDNIISEKNKMVSLSDMAGIYSNIKTYYLVTNEEELAWVSTNVNSGSLLTNNAEFILLNDLDLSGKYWTPIGTTSLYPFQGVFNLNGHKISGVTVDSSNLTYAGLFGNTSGAKIINGYVTDVFIKLISESNQINVYAGAVVGKGYNTSIINVKVSTAMSVTSNAGIFVGGAIGSLTGTKDYTINNVYVTKALNKQNSSGETTTTYARYIDIQKYQDKVIEVDDEGKRLGRINSESKYMIGVGGFSNGGNVYIGGVVGYASGYGQNLETINTIENAYSDVNIAGITTSNVSRSFAGGIIGYALGEVKMESVKSLSAIKTFTDQYDFVGGIAGYVNDSNITNAYFSGYLEHCMQRTNNRIISRVGGIVAFMETEGILKYCVNNGEMMTNGVDNVHSGGIIGYSRDRGYAKDEHMAYNGDNFGSAVGLYEQTGPENTPEEIKNHYSDNLSVVNSSNGFDANKWVSGILISNKYYIMGSDNSLIVTSVDGGSGGELSKGGIFVSNLSSVTLSYASGSFIAGDILRISGRNSKGEYVCSDIALQTNMFESISGGTLGTFKLSNILNKLTGDNAINVSNTLTIFVQLIQVETE